MRMGATALPMTAIGGKRSVLQSQGGDRVDVLTNSVDRNESPKQHNLTPRMAAIGRTLSGTAKSARRASIKSIENDEPDQMVEVIMMNLDGDRN